MRREASEGEGACLSLFADRSHLPLRGKLGWMTPRAGVKTTPAIETRLLGPPLGIGSPRRRVSIAGVVFTPARGVIHPSFPLRGRWERSVKSDKQAPSPSLASSHISSFETRPRNPAMHGSRQCTVHPRNR